VGRGPETPPASPCSPPDTRATENAWYVISDLEAKFGQKDPKKFRRWIIARPTRAALLTYPRTVGWKVGLSHEKHINCPSERCKLDKDAFIKLYDPQRLDCNLFIRSRYSCREGDKLVTGLVRTAARIHDGT
jgi:hypothetical protein